MPTRNPRLLALIVACVMFMAQLDSTVVLTALPQIALNFHIQPVDLSIGVTVYIMVQVVFLPSSAWIADRCGARTVFAMAIAGFTLASILCGLCQTLPEFISARALQGFAAALMTPVGRVVLLQSTEKEDLISVMTISSVPMLIAPTIGPPLGGLITTYLSWPWIFFLNVPIGVISTLLVLRHVPNLPGHQRPFDVTGFILTGIGITTFLYGMDRVSSPAADRTVPFILIGIGLVFSILAIRHARTHPHPLISLEPFKVRTFSIATLGAGAMARIPMRALMFILPLMFQITLGLSAFVAGMLLLALSGGDLLLKTMVTPALKRFGFRSVLIVCALFSSVTVALCAGFSLQTSLATMFGVLLVCGMFRSLLFTGMSTLIYADIPQEQSGAATVLWNMMQQVTNALSVSFSTLLFALSPLIFGERGAGLTLTDCRFALAVMAVIGVLPLISFSRLPSNAGARLSGHGQ